MKLRAICIALMSCLLLATTSSSESLFVLTFPAEVNGSTRLDERVTEELTRRGFVRSAEGATMQYGTRPAWVEVLPQGRNSLALYFSVLRGGCSSDPGADFAGPLVAEVASSLAGEFGVADIVETRAANGRPDLRKSLKSRDGAPDMSLERTRDR